jgi:arylsulfatase A-like enzyme
MKLSRRNAILAAGIAAAAGGGAWIGLRRRSAPRARLTVPSGRRYNVLLVVSDQERAWDHYPAGFIAQHAPARQWLRENGVSFTRFQTPSPFCSPARGVIYSGVQSPNNGVWDNVPLVYASPLRRDVPTLGTMFQDAGYITGYTGKWHLSRMSEHPNAREAARIAATIRSYGFDETDVTEETDGPVAGWRHDKRTVDRALAFLKRRGANEQPWFLAVNLLNPHDVMYYTAGAEMTASRVSQFPDKSARPPTGDPLYAEDLGYALTENYGPASFGARPSAVQEYHLTFSEAMGHMPYGDASADREMQNYYWNCTRDCDRHLQNLLDGLRAAGALENTIIVFTSDHGELLGVHGMRGKGTGAYRESSHVPAIVVHPEGRKGAEHPAVLSHIDWAPTLMRFAGARPDELRAQLPMLAGRDFSRLVFEPASDWSRDADGVLLHWTSIAYLDHRNVARFDKIRTIKGPQRILAMKEMMDESVRKRGQMRGAYDGRWKFSRYSTPLSPGRPGDWETLAAGYDLELYDTLVDPGETRNLAADALGHKQEIIRLNSMLNALVDAEIGTDDAGFLPLFLRL